MLYSHNHPATPHEMDMTHREAVVWGELTPRYC